MGTGPLQGPEHSDAPPKTVTHLHSVALRVPGNNNYLTVGGQQPLRLIAPFGFSSAADLGLDLERHITSLAEAGADAVQELSTIGPYRELRPRLTANVGVAYGTVLTYELVSRLGKVTPVTEAVATELAVQVLDEQCTQGISYTTIHASLSRSLLASTGESRRRRAIAVPSRAAGMLMTLMRRHLIDNPLFLAWPELVAILRKHKVAVSMGSSLRPAAICDAMDEAQRQEIRAQSTLVSLAHREGVQVLVEGLSHALPRDIARYIALVHEACEGAPATALGPLPTDVAAGRDHIAAVIGIVFGRLAGLASVNVVTSKEHLTMPTTGDMVEALAAGRVAAYVADAIQAGRSSPRDRLMSEAREALDWTAQAQYALFPELVKALSPEKEGTPCTICAGRCPHLVRNTWPTAVEPQRQAPSLRQILEEALAPVKCKAEVIWFGSLAHRQQSGELDSAGLAGSDIDLTILSEDAEETSALLGRTLWDISIQLARSNYGSHISIVSETPKTFLRRLDQRPDLWNAIWREGYSLATNDSILNRIQRSEVRHVSGNLLVRYAVRSLELAVLQIALASMSRAPRSALDQILKRKADGAFGPLSLAMGSFLRDKELSRRSVLSFLGRSNFAAIDSDEGNAKAQLDRLLRLINLTLAEARASSLPMAEARTRVKKLGTLISSAVANWSTFRLAPETAHSLLYQTGPQYSFLRWAFLEGGSIQIFKQ
jgi:phosphomethylpyrimidine synthase